MSFSIILQTFGPVAPDLQSIVLMTSYEISQPMRVCIRKKVHFNV